MLDRRCSDLLQRIARFFAKDFEDTLDTRLTESTEAPELGRPIHTAWAPIAVPSGVWLELKVA